MDGGMTRQATPDQHIQSRLSTVPFNKLARLQEVGRNYLCGGGRVEGAHTRSELGPPLAA